MGCMLRSDEMSFCEMYLQPDTAFDIISHLGDLGCVEFTDMTPDISAFLRNHISELCRCAELERKLHYMQFEMKKDNIYVRPLVNEPPALLPHDMNAYEAMVEKWHDDIIEISAYQAKLVKNHVQLSEMYYVLKNVEPMLGDVEFGKDPLFSKAGGEGGLGGRLFVVTGVVRRAKGLAFETMLWRISRGNIYYRLAANDKLFEDPSSGHFIRKVAFLAICQGEQLSSRVDKVCSGFGVNLYPCPKAYEERRAMTNKLDKSLADLSRVLRKSRYHRCKALRTIGKSMNKWLAETKKAKSIYHSMNLFTMDITNKCLIGECWVPDRDLDKVQRLLGTISDKAGSNVPSFMSRLKTSDVPPTFHRTNKFTNGFQALINAYGASTYGEINPALYALITFPFLFAVMFGDSGHGLIMLSAAAWMVIKEKQFLAQRSTNEIWNIFFGGRYVILMMSIFSMFTGFIYNDWFSKPLRLMPSFWVNTYSPEELAGHETLALDPAGKTMSTYAFGVDPIWVLSTNQIMYVNSLKMKLSIILGIVHMLFGLWIGFFNHLYFKERYRIVLEFIPKVLFLCCLFMWLCFMIFFKWFKYSAKNSDIKLKPGCAPLILILFIDMTLGRSTTVEDTNCEPYMFGPQEIIQKVLIIVGLVQIPILLFGTPLYKLRASRKSKQSQKNYEAGHDGGHNEDVSFSEAMIHSGVETIEYVLSTISHTASYLRLWALSLAHAQLSEMLWGMILAKLALKDHTMIGSVRIFVVFFIWAMFTVSILVIMEGLSAFLHTLRLHWVEFMSKFYGGMGHVFSPFSFNKILYGVGKEDTSQEGSCKKGHRHKEENE